MSIKRTARSVGDEPGSVSVRVQSLTPGIIRIETSRPDGSFCDEPTFTVVARPDRTPGDSTAGDGEIARFGDLIVRPSVRPDNDVPPGGPSLSLELVRGDEVLWRAALDRGLQSRQPEPDRLPRPSEVGAVWVLHDHPRVIPPEWGALPPPDDYHGPDSGWRIEAEVIDIYLCVYDGDLELLWRQFTSLTGRTPMPPLWMFGLWHSRYYPYSHKTALEVIDQYRELGFPLDCFVIDTDWRVGASRGYEINTELFPDMAGFLAECKQRGLHTVFNDHPEHKDLEPLQAELFAYRSENLTRLIDMGLSTWWFDRNWGDIIRGPAPGLESAVWGQRLYNDIIADHRPGERPAILSMTTPHPAAHRFPIWWTGDIHSDWQSLAEVVRDAVDDGLQMRPYTAPDIGGHIGYPSPEQYIRWIQWASVAPTMRLHSGPFNRFRYPWRYGDTALSVSRDYTHMRYRLLPLLYSLAHAAHRTGMPMHRSMDLVNLAAPVWSRSSQFLLGDALLVAPVVTALERPVADPGPHRFMPPLRRRVWFAERLGDESYGINRLPKIDPDEIGYDSEIRINPLNSSEKGMVWGQRYLIVWDGVFQIDRDGWYRIVLGGNARSELTVDGEVHPQILAAFHRGNTEANLELAAGTHSLTVASRHEGGRVLVVTLAIEELTVPQRLPPAPRRFWLPAGDWRNLWSGEVYSGPAEAETVTRIEQMPMFARCGSIVPLTAVVEHTTTAYWRDLTIEVFPHMNDGESTFTLVEDDGHSQEYLSDGTVDTTVTLTRRGKVISLLFGTDGTHRESITVRFHLLPDETVTALKIDGTPMNQFKRLPSPIGDRTTPLPLDDSVSMFGNGETVAVVIPAGTEEVDLELGRS